MMSKEGTGGITEIILLGILVIQSLSLVFIPSTSLAVYLTRIISSRYSLEPTSWIPMCSTKRQTTKQLVILTCIYWKIEI